MKFPIYGKIIQMFQTTNQFMFKIPSEKEIFLGSGFVLSPLLGCPHYVTLMGFVGYEAGCPGVNDWNTLW